MQIMDTLQLIKDYQNKIPTYKLQEKYKLNWENLTKILKENNVYKKNNSMSYSYDIEEYIRANYWIKSNKELAEKTGIQEDGVRVLAKRLNFPLKGSGWKYNETILNLNKTSNEFYYFLGWVTTDGNISKNFHNISLKITDQEIVKRFKSLFINCSNIYSYKKRCENCKIMYQLLIFSKELALYLNSLGITPNKSKTLDIQKEIWNNHFIRGVFEGDGHVRNTLYKDGSKRYEAGFVSASETFINQLANYLLIHNIKLIISKESIYFRARITGKENLKNFYLFLYKDCNEWYLLRKKQVLDQLFSNE